MSLLGIGTGLSGLMSGYNAGQQALGQKQFLQQLLQRNKSQQQGNEILGQLATAGQLPGFSGGIGTGLAGGLTPQAPQPPMPGQAPTPTPAPSPLPAAPPQPSGSPPSMQGSADLGGQTAPDAEMSYDPAADVARDASAATPSPTPSPGASSTPTPAADPAPEVPTSPSGHIIMTDPQTGATFDMSQFSQRLDFNDLGKRIQAIRPDADPAAVGIALQNVNKLMQSGDKMQQLQVQAMLKYLGYQANVANHKQISADKERGQDLTHEDRQSAQTGANTRAAGRETGVQGRFDANQARLTAQNADRKAYQAQQQALAKEREARQAGNATAMQAARAQSAALSKVRAEIAALSAKINGPAGTFTKADASRLDALVKQLGGE